MIFHAKAADDGMRVTHGLCTHFHVDHVGGKVPKWMKKQVFGGSGPSFLPGIKEVCPFFVGIFTQRFCARYGGIERRISCTSEGWHAGGQ